MNSVNIVGRLTRDVELRYTVDELAIATFTVALDRYMGKDEAGNAKKDTDFIDCKCFGKKAEFISTWSGKGLTVAVHGRLQQNKYTDKDGKTHTYIEVVADDVEPVEWKKKNEVVEDFTF